MALNNIWLIAASFGLVSPEVNHSVFVMNDLAVKMQEHGRPADAERLYRTAINMCAAEEGQACGMHPKLLNNAGSLYLQQERYSESQQMLEKAVQLFRLGARSLDLASSVGNLAGLNFGLGRFDAAESGFAEALEIRLLVLGPNDTRTLAVSERLAEVLRQRGKTSQAEELYRKILAVRESVEALNGLALVKRLTGSLDEAESLCRRALEMRQDQAEPGDLASLQNNLGLILAAKGKFQEARETYLRALAVANRKQTPGILSNLAALLQKNGDFRGAQPLLLRAIALDSDQAQLARDLGRAGIGAASLHRYTQAEEFLTRAVAISGDDLEGAVIRATLADVCLRRNKADAAVGNYAKATNILTAAWGASDKRLLPIFTNYSAALRATQDYATAAKIDAAATRVEVSLAIK